ncbi:MAG TPA: GNAT family N-acetyltransferase [Bryobacteraceae bacterium]|nr:GNAT family N-acetyltransferase [Bryobacteraceae bacterium]
MAATYTIRRGVAEDAETIVRQRWAMFHEMGYRDQPVLDAMAVAFRPWLLRMMHSGEYLAWFAVTDGGSIAAGLGLWLMDWPPHMIGPGARRGNILNVYTAPDHRRQGLARQLMQTALAWCRAHGIRAVILHASQEGAPLYEALGFRPTNEMRIVLEPGE